MVFTGNSVDFPDYFTATTSNGCFGTFYPTPPTPTSYVLDFESAAHGTSTVWGGDTGGIVIEDDGSGTNNVLKQNWGVVRLTDPAAEPFWKTTDSGLSYDNYTVEVDVSLENHANTESGGSTPYLMARRYYSNHFYLLGIRNSWNNDGCPSVGNGAEVRFSVYNGSWNCDYGAQFDSPHPYFQVGHVYHLTMTCIDNTIECWVEEGATVIDHFTITDSLFPAGPPGLRIYGAAAYYDNFTVTPIP